MTKSNKKGFTLVELIIVIAIIGILAGVLFPTITGYLKNARISTHEQEASAINNVLAVESIFNDVNYFQPQELETLLVGMDYELTSTVEDYAFVYDVSKNRVEFIPVSDARSREKVGATVYEGIESVFGNHLAYIDQSDTSIRRTIDGLRSLVADATSEVSNRPEGTNTTPVNNYQRVLDKMDQLFNEMVPEDSTDSVHVNLRRFSPKNGGLYIDESEMYGNLDAVITGVSFTPMISTIPSPYKGLKLRFGLIIELPSSVDLVQSSAFSNIEVYGSEGRIENPTEAQKPVIKSAESVNFTGVISSYLRQVVNKSAVTYKVFTGYTLKYELQKRIFIDGKFNKTEFEASSNISYDSIDVGDIYSLIPRITMNNNQIDLNTLVSIDVRSKIYGDVQIFSAAGIDKDFNGYKLTNLGSIIDVKHSVSNIYGTGVMTNDEITGKRVIVSDPLQGYNFVNYSNVRVEVVIDGVGATLKKVTSNDTSFSEGVISAYLGDYIFERDGNTDLTISGIKVYATINGAEQLVFAKKIK